MRVCIALLTLLFAVSLTLAVENQAFLGIFAETQDTKMVGMPDMPDMPDMEGIDLANLPGGLNIPAFGPKRLLTVRLWSPTIAPPEASASLGIPTGLKLGKTLKLSLYRPEPGEGVAGGGDPNVQMPDFTIKRYWGSSSTVKEGQPEVFSMKDLTPEEKARMESMARDARKAGASYFYKPNWTTGYWPAGKQLGTVKKDAAMEGTYALTTNYTGNVEIAVPKTVNFLDPIALSSPKFDKAIPFDKAITFKWKAIPGVLGYYAQIIGVIGQNTLIIWSSSEVRTDPGMAWDYLQMAEVRENVKATKFMAPDRVEVTVPAGIFKDCDFVNFQMIGYGPGVALDEAQPLPRVQTKTTLSAMLGGKMMKEMGGMPGEGEQPIPEE